jgi:hypothetical protein
MGAPKLNENGTAWSSSASVLGASRGGRFTAVFAQQFKRCGLGQSDCFFFCSPISVIRVDQW